MEGSMWWLDYTQSPNTLIGESFEQVLFSDNSNNQQSNENKTYLRISHVIERIDHAGYFALFDMPIPGRRKLSMLADTRGNANRWLDKNIQRSFSRGGRARNSKIKPFEMFQSEVVWKFDVGIFSEHGTKHLTAMISVGQCPSQEVPLHQFDQLDQDLLTVLLFGILKLLKISFV